MGGGLSEDPDPNPFDYGSILFHSNYDSIVLYKKVFFFQFLKHIQLSLDGNFNEKERKIRAN